MKPNVLKLIIKKALPLTFTLAFGATGVFAQQCLHGPGETTDQAARRQMAVFAFRAINTAEAQYLSINGRAGNLQELAASPFWADLTKSALSTAPGGELLPGFEFHITTNGGSYSMSLKDKTDPCALTVFSNDMGIIFTGYPIDFTVTPSKRPVKED